MGRKTKHQHKFVLTQGGYGQKPFYACQCGAEQCESCNGSGYVDLSYMAPSYWGFGDPADDENIKCLSCNGKGYLTEKEQGNT